jgi:hypothetical protein
MRTTMVLTVACAVLAPPAAAWAQEAGDLPVVTRKPGMEHLHTPMGMSIQAGGGVTNFAAQSARERTNVGGYWDARAVIGTRAYVAVELAYVGNLAPIDGQGLDPNAVLLGQGAEADLRLQAPFFTPAGALVEPFIFGGGGWMHYRVANAEFNASDVRETNDVATIPFGAGLAFGYRGFLADARFTYRQTFNEDLFPVPDGKTDLQNWSAGAMLGYEF